MPDASARRSRLDFLAAQYDGPIPPAELAAARAGRFDALLTEEMRANIAFLAALARDSVAAAKAHRARGDFIAAGRALERALGYARSIATYRHAWKADRARLKVVRGAPVAGT